MGKREEDLSKKRVMVSVIGDSDGSVTQFLADLEKKDLFPKRVILLRVDPSPIVTLVAEFPIKEVSKGVVLCGDVTWPINEQKKTHSF